MVIFVLASWLFMRSGYRLVVSKLTDALAVEGPGWGDWEVPSTGSIAKARVRLGAAPLKLLFERVAGPSGEVGAPGVFYAGRRVLSIDGFTSPRFWSWCGGQFCWLAAGRDVADCEPRARTAVAPEPSRMVVGGCLGQRVLCSHTSGTVY